MYTTEVDERPAAVVVSVQGRATLLPVDADRLESEVDISYLPRKYPLTRTEAIRAFVGADVAAFTPKVAPPVDEALLAELPRLRGIALYATGYDFLDVEQLHRHGVALVHLPHYSTTSVAEHALGMLLTLSRRIHLGNDRSRGLVKAETSLRGFELAERTLGVVGLGRIGTRFTQLGQAMGMHVLAADPRHRPVTAAGVQVVPLDELLARAEVVCVLCSASNGGGPIFHTTELERMRPGSVLVNASRAYLVDNDAVAAAIRSGHLRGYAVDDVAFNSRAYADLLAEGRIVQTGHSAWWSDEVLHRGGRMWAESIRRLAIGAPIGLVEPSPTPEPVESVMSGERGA